jgi:hypothetical protein
MTKELGIEAMVSRHWVRYQRPNDAVPTYGDQVTVCTMLGPWSMPYEAFKLLFGVELVPEGPGKCVQLRLHESNGQ